MASVIIIVLVVGLFSSLSELSLVVVPLSASIGGMVVFLGLWIEKEAEKEGKKHPTKFGNLRRMTGLKSEIGWWILMFGIAIEIVTSFGLAATESWKSYTVEAEQREYAFEQSWLTNLTIEAQIECDAPATTDAARFAISVPKVENSPQHSESVTLFLFGNPSVTNVSGNQTFMFKFGTPGPVPTAQNEPIRLINMMQARINVIDLNFFPTNAKILNFRGSITANGRKVLRFFIRKSEVLDSNHELGNIEVEYSSGDGVWKEEKSN